MTIAEWCAAGWHVLPMAVNGRAALVRGWREAASNDEAQIRAWAREFPGCGFAVMTGRMSAVVGLDIEMKNGLDGERDLAELVERLGPLPAMGVMGTPSGGRHLYFRAPPGREVRTRGLGKLAPGIEVRGENTALRFWPCIYPSDTALRSADQEPLSAGVRVVLSERPPWRMAADGTLAELPHAWLDHLDRLDARPAPAPAVRTGPIGSRYAEAALRSACDRIAAAANGTRNGTLNSEAHGLGQLIGGGLLDEGDAAHALAAAALAAGLDRHEVEATLRSGLRAGIAQPRRAS